MWTVEPAETKKIATSGLPLPEGADAGLQGRIATNLASRPVVFLLLALYGAEAGAHVKWFSEFNLGEPPLSLDRLLDGRFVLFYLASVLFVYVFFWVDRWLYRRAFLANVTDRIVVTDALALTILRITSFIFFLSLFIYGYIGNSFYLTPELATDAGYVKWIQLLIAVFALARLATPLIGVLILVLFALVVKDYGPYHALDYVVFLGLSWFFLGSMTKASGWVVSRYVVLFASLGLNLGWLAVEKWAFPHWTYPLLEQNPHLLMGLPADFYMVLAGFVEFVIAFTLLGAASSFSRMVALGLATIFILAIYQFGLIDAVGHSYVLAILAILVLRGPTSARYFLVLGDKSIWAEAYFMTGLYALALTLILIAYYGLYFILNA